MSGKVFNEKCVITGEPARYRDPVTGQPYATLAAFKILRERFTQQGGVIPTLGPTAGEALSAAEGTQEKNQVNAHQRAEMEAVGKADEKGEIRVTPLQLLALDESSEVMSMLKDEQLSRLVRAIDSSPDPHKALSEARSNPQMAELISKILSAVGEHQTTDE